MQKDEFSIAMESEEFFNIIVETKRVIQENRGRRVLPILIPSNTSRCNYLRVLKSHISNSSNKYMILGYFKADNI